LSPLERIKAYIEQRTQEIMRSAVTATYPSELADMRSRYEELAKLEDFIATEKLADDLTK